ncbi:MAG: hypothetical protein AAF710_11985 [Planctomycetota bacterium]
MSGVRVDRGAGAAGGGPAIDIGLRGGVAGAGDFAWGLPSMVCGPLAIVFARMTRRQIARGSADSSSAGVATAGMVLGIIGTILGVVAVGFIALMVIGTLSMP